MDQNVKQYNIEINDQNTQQKTIFDLNKIFHLDLSYNFDLLKNLLFSMIKNQQSKDDKIADLESQLLDFKIIFNEAVGDPETARKLKEAKPKMTSTLLKEKQFPNTTCLNNEIHPPPNDIILETSPNNDPLINKIIVSYLNI